MLATWALLGVAALAVLVTYARLPPDDLYHTSVDGLAGGAGRTLVFLNFPVALVAAAIAGLCARGPARWIAVALCLVAVLPGVVSEADLDAKPVNLLPALGVAIALVLTARASRHGRSGEKGRRSSDRARIALGTLLVLLAIPWLFAEIGFYAPDPILADEVPRGETIAAVHLGHHHGTDGVLLALSALLLSRTLQRGLLSVYLALMLAYGGVNALQDAWLEQVVKRGWTDWQIPVALRPGLSPVWAVIVALAVAIELLWFRREQTRYARTSSSHSDIGT